MKLSWELIAGQPAPLAGQSVPLTEGFLSLDILVQSLGSVCTGLQGSLRLLRREVGGQCYSCGTTPPKHTLHSIFRTLDRWSKITITWLFLQAFECAWSRNGVNMKQNRGLDGRVHLKSCLRRKAYVLANSDVSPAHTTSNTGSRMSVLLQLLLPIICKQYYYTMNLEFPLLVESDSKEGFLYGKVKTRSGLITVISCSESWKVNACTLSSWAHLELFFCWWDRTVIPQISRQWKSLKNDLSGLNGKRFKNWLKPETSNCQGDAWVISRGVLKSHSWLGRYVLLTVGSVLLTAGLCCYGKLACSWWFGLFAYSGNSVWSFLLTVRPVQKWTWSSLLTAPPP